MGGMQTWIWAQRYPDAMDIAGPMASLPTEMSGRNWMMRRLIIDTIRTDPEWKDGNYTAQPKAFKMAGVKHSDVKMLSLYDAFTITPILFTEDLGFCKKGEGGSYFEGGKTAPGGSNLPVNTSGGGLSYCHPGMYGLLVMIEAIRQVRGECDKRQVKSCDVALAHGNGGVLSSQCTVIFGSEATV